MSKWNLIVDVADCTNCQACVLATHDEHVDNDFRGYAAPMPKHGHRWIDIKRKERGQGPMIDVAYLPIMCQHCDHAPCLTAAPDAVTKRADGIVVIDPVKSKGRKDIVESCPYGAIWWNEERQIPQHWIFDAHLLDSGWTEPRAAQVCATGAIGAVKTDDEAMRRRAEAEGLETLHPEYGTRPRVWYRNLRRFTACFIGGSVEADADGTVQCVADAAVTLYRDGTEIASTQSDAFGDFKFDGLPPESGAYDVEIRSGAATKRLTTKLGSESAYLGNIRI